MDECFAVVLGAAAVLALLGGAISGIVAVFQIRALKARLVEVERYLVAQERRQRLAESPAPDSTASSAPVASDVPTRVPVAPVAPVAPPVELEPKPVSATPPVSEFASPPAPRQTSAERWTEIESLVGKRWMTWAGALILFLSAAFFVKYAFDNNWLGPGARVALGVFFGVALLVAGEAAIRRAMTALGQGLVGGGLAVVYVSLFAARSLYQILSTGGAFGALVAVVAGAMALAVLHDSIVMAVLATAGGYLTPALLSTGVDARDALFAYVLLLDVGVLLVAVFRQWRLLDTLAFVGTFGLYAGWYVDYYQPPALVPATTWLIGFYVLFQTLPFVHHFRHKTVFALERFLMVMANVTITGGYATAILADEHKPVLGWLALGMAAANAALAVFTRRRIPDETRGAMVFVGLGAALLTIAVPLHLGLSSTTLMWAVEGPLLLWLALRFRYEPLRWIGAGVMGLAVARFLVKQVPLHAALFIPVANTAFGTGAFVVAATGFFAWLSTRGESGAGSRVLRDAAALIAVLFGLFLVGRETHEYLTLAQPYDDAIANWFWRTHPRHFLPAAVWAIGAAIWFGVSRRRSWNPGIALSSVVVAVSAVVSLNAYMHPAINHRPWLLNVCFLSMVLGMSALIFVARELGRSSESIDWLPSLIGIIAYTGAIAFALVVLTLENYGALRDWAGIENGSWAGQMGVSVTWGVFAVALLLLGFRRNLRAVRLAALGLMGLTAVKLVLFDMSGIKQVWRILSFVVVGLLMIAASYLYHLVEKRMESGESK